MGTTAATRVTSTRTKIPTCPLTSTRGETTTTSLPTIATTRTTTTVTTATTRTTTVTMRTRWNRRTSTSPGHIDTSISDQQTTKTTRTIRTEMIKAKVKVATATNLIKKSTQTWVNLAESLSLIARKLADRDDGGEGGNGEEGGADEGDGDDEEEGKKDENEEMMSEASTNTYKPIRKSKKYKKSHEPRSYRHKRSAEDEAGVTESQAMEEALDLVDSLREGMQRRNRCQCTTKGPKGHHKPCSQKFANTGHKYFCYVKHKCHKSKPSKHNHRFHWVTHKCCGKNCVN